MKFLFKLVVSIFIFAVGLLMAARGADYSWAECPEYARVCEEGGLIIVGAEYCGACRNEEQALTKASIQFAVVDLQRHPLTAKLLRTAPWSIPETILVRKRLIVWRARFASVLEIRGHLGP